MILTHLVLFSFLGGAGQAQAPVPVVVDQATPYPVRERSRKERARYVKDQRIRLGIVPPDASPAVVEKLEAYAETAEVVRKEEIKELVPDYKDVYEAYVMVYREALQAAYEEALQNEVKRKRRMKLLLMVG